MPSLFWATTAITHATPIDAEAIGQLHKLIRIIVTGPAVVDVAACEARGIVVRHFQVDSDSVPGRALIGFLETLVDDVKH